MRQLLFPVFNQQETQTPEGGMPGREPPNAGCVWQRLRRDSPVFEGSVKESHSLLAPFLKDVTKQTGFRLDSRRDVRGLTPQDRPGKLLLPVAILQAADDLIFTNYPI